MAINFYLNPRKDKKGEAPIQAFITVCTLRVTTSVGYSVSSDNWDGDKQRVKDNTQNSKGIVAATINATLNAIAAEAAKFEGKCVAEERKKPKDKAAEDALKEEIYLNIPSLPQKRKKGDREAGKSVTIRKSFFEYYDMFLAAEGETVDDEISEGRWSEGTHKKLRTVRQHLKAFNPNLTFEYFTEKGLICYVNFLRKDLEMRNDTIKKQLGYLRWFLKWGYMKRLHTTNDFEIFKPNLKMVRGEKRVVYLSWEELMKLYTLEIPQTKKYLDRVRDVFCFCCFTSLRYSDAHNLKKVDIYGDAIHIVTEKTDDAITIDLNDYSSAILAKYADVEFPNGAALPVISNQRYNDYIKELGVMCGFDEPITKTYYVGNKKHTDNYKKWELMGSHTARRTFICNALILGIPADIVMKWTGHCDYKAMQPYIDVADGARKEAMKLFNRK